MSLPEINKPAPDFTLPSSTGDSITLSALKGQNVVLYFYPKDDTPGCTTQACSLRDNIKDFNGLATVLGISPDDLKKHDKFITKYELNFPLLADEGSKVCEQYGVWVEKSMYGKKYMGVARTTFIINKEGILTNILEKVKPETHTDDVLKILKEL